MSWWQRLLNRRDLLKVGAGASAALVGAAALAQRTPNATRTADGHPIDHGGHGGNRMIGTVDHTKNGFDPLQLLTDWDYGKVSRLPNGQTLREYTFIAQEKDIEIAPGVTFPAWTYNGRVPGPTIRCTEGDRLRVRLINQSRHPHTIHFHGVHPWEMDGVPGAGAGEIPPGGSTVYEFDAEPFGCHLYHCHATSLKRHIHKGMYGAFIIDPEQGRPPAREFVMMQNAFDTNFDGGNEVYAVNTIGFEYARRPIPVQKGELVRLYLINILEFDLINSFHLHGNMFDYYDHGTTLTPTSRIVDTTMQAQGQRGIVEFRYKYTGQFMFHPHISEFTELGWMGMFNVVEPKDFPRALQDVGLNDTWNERALNGFAAKQKGSAT
ncbi:multicopper oxidase domain-containing protein [Deinococcus yavapaiensis]|uniref:Copper-containing nitrite reductase n=1 Tax=Deinococcus yavapaiensis KR-236 TaxID=694435 RepID=A0A318S3A8_9DEIO|nr:multicopper oxidase domain-containing protein [Deinococcus yavapaiensis]PYE50937.1 multicopper oxidase [Deinococcus yavapaiensis KR-236]